MHWLRHNFGTIPPRASLLACASALLQIVIFPIAGPLSAPLTALGWIALIPFLMAILLPGCDGHPLRMIQAAALGYACGILWYLGNCYWIYQTMYLYGGMPKPVAFGILILFALYLGLYHAFFAALLSFVRSLSVSAALALTPFIWVAVELARGRITGFPWDLLGNSQVDNLLLTRIAPVAGVMAMSFVIAAINAALTAGFFLDGKKRVLLPAAAAVIAVSLQLGIPSGKHAFLEATDQMAVMMQENLEVGVMAKNTVLISPGDEMKVFSQMSLNPRRYSAVENPTVVIWPEAPSDLFSFESSFQQQLGNLARAANAPAIIGSIGIDRTTKNDRGYYKFDSASLFESDGTYSGRYDKLHLVPWGEYVPFHQFFGFFVQKLTKDAGDMDPGAERSIFSAGGHSYGIFICYESIFGDEVRQFVLNGAQVLVNISDDGWYGDTGAPWQHLNMTRMRAIENHRWLLLDTNTGITTSIDPEGRTTIQAPRHVREAFAFPFAFLSGTTFYTRHGDWFAWMCVFITLAAMAAARLRASSSSQTHRNWRAFHRKQNRHSINGEPVDGVAIPNVLPPEQSQWAR
jgi:apolipoprotein N-acyltransferase